MVILRIEHKIKDFESWKRAFDSDPIDRKKSGVISYRIYRPADDPFYVVIDLEFNSKAEAENALSTLKELWSKVEGTVMFNPQTSILEVVERFDYPNLS